MPFIRIQLRSARSLLDAHVAGSSPTTALDICMTPGEEHLMVSEIANGQAKRYLHVLQAVDLNKVRMRVLSNSN